MPTWKPLWSDPKAGGHLGNTHPDPKRIWTGVTSWPVVIFLLPNPIWEVSAQALPYLLACGHLCGTHSHLKSIYTVHRRCLVVSGHLGVTHSHLRSVCTGVTWPVSIFVLTNPIWEVSAQALPRGQWPSWSYPLPITFCTGVTSSPTEFLMLPIPTWEVSVLERHRS